MSDASSVSIAFPAAQGDPDSELNDTSGRLIRAAAAAPGSQWIALGGPERGPYCAPGFNDRVGSNVDYSLTLDAPEVID